MKRTFQVLAAALAWSLTLLGASPAEASARTDVVPDPYGLYTPVLVVMDTSGSMADSTGGSNPTVKIDAARAAVLDLISAMGTGQQFGLIAYPGRSSPTDEDGCEIGHLEVAPGPLNVSPASAAVRRMVPSGGTPTGPVLANAASFLRSTYGDLTGGVIIVVSDGEANCGTPPCEVARAVREAGLEVQFNTIGLNLSDSESEQLRCVADVGGGTYVDVVDGIDPSDAIARAARGALSLAVDAPDALTVVTGTGNGGSTVAVTVSSTGRVPAANVRVSLAVTRTGTGAGNVVVPRPVRYLGNIPTGQSRTVEFFVRPDDDTGAGDAQLAVSALAANAAPAQWTSSSSIADTLSTERLGGVLADVHRVVVLGDSYSSGEGAGPYLSGTNSETKVASACHRSNHQYAAALWGADATTILACSGAVTGDFTSPQTSGGNPVTPQLLTLRNAALSETPPEAVLLSIGGNDAGFGSVATGCVIGKNCSLKIVVRDSARTGGWVTPVTDLLERAMDVQPSITQVLTTVDQAVNDVDALAARDGKPIPIIVIPYPRIVPPTAGGAPVPSGCTLGLSSAELGELNQFLDALNTSVSLATYTLSSRGRPVYVASDVIDAFQPDHTLCESSESYANPVVVLGDARVESLHPTIKGQAAIARALVSWSNTRAARPMIATGTPVWSPQVQVRAPVRFGDMILGGAPPLRAYSAAGEPAYVAAEGYEPGSGVVIRLDSTPRTLTTLTADDGGRVTGWVRLPADTPTGAHHIVAFGNDADGQQIAVASTLRVLPAGGPGLFVLLGLGLLLVLASTVTLWWTRGKRFVRG